MIFALLLSQAYAGALICNDGTQSPSCSVCRAGCCSYHGGCSGYSAPSRSYPSYPPAAAPPRDAAWGLDSGVNNAGTLVYHATNKEVGSVSFSYACYADASGWVGAAVILWLDPPSGKTWGRETEPTPSTDTGTGSVVVNLMSGNSITRILSWSWKIRSGMFHLVKITDGIDSYAGEAHLTVEELVRFSTAELIQVHVGEEVYRLSLQGSQAAIAAANAACAR